MKFDLASWFQTWVKALTRPAVATFDEITAQPGAAPAPAYLWMAISGALVGLVRWIAGGSYLDILTQAIAAVLGLAVSAWLVDLVARKFFKGAGSYRLLAFAFGAIAAPVYLAGNLLRLIPFVGELLFYLLGMYSLVLQVLATRSVHKFDTNRAVAAVLIPMLTIVALAVAVWTLVVVTFLAAWNAGLPLGGL